MLIMAFLYTWGIAIALLFQCAPARSCETSECLEIKYAIASPIKVHQSFENYKENLGNAPIKLLFPGGRKASPNDPRGDQQEHKGFYTIDNQDYCNPHLQGNIFNPELWAEIPDESFDIIHIEVPGGLFLYGAELAGRKEKDDFILNQVKKKSKSGASLFVDLRWNHFPIKNNFVVPDNYEASKDFKNRTAELDPDSFFDFTLGMNISDSASYFYDILGNTFLNKDEIESLAERFYNTPTNEDVELYRTLEKKVGEKRALLTEEEDYQFLKPYVVFYDKHTRTDIFQQYDKLFKRYGFERKHPVQELRGKIQNELPLPPHLKCIEGKVLFQGMCFLDNIAEYTKR